MPLFLPSRVFVMIAAADLANNLLLQDLLRRLPSVIPEGSHHYSYLGLNFHDDGVSSCKLYYTLLDEPICNGRFPVPELENIFASYAKLRSAFHVKTPFVPGCGITFTIKFDAVSGVSRGIYFRVREDARQYVEKFLLRIGVPIEEHSEKFDMSGVLKYLSIDEAGCIRERNYIYCQDCRFLDAFDVASGISFSRAECLEISTDWNDPTATENMKFIGISKVPLAGERVSNRTRCVAELAERQGLIAAPWFSLYGYYLHSGVTSAFFFSSRRGDNSVLSPSLRIPEV